MSYRTYCHLPRRWKPTISHDGSMRMVYIYLPLPKKKTPSFIYVQSSHGSVMGEMVKLEVSRHPGGLPVVVENHVPQLCHHCEPVAGLTEVHPGGESGYQSVDRYQVAENQHLTGKPEKIHAKKLTLAEFSPQNSP